MKSIYTHKVWLLLAVFSAIFAGNLIAVDNAYYNSGQSTVRPGRFFVAPQVEIYAAGSGGEVTTESTTPSIVPKENLVFNPNVGAGISMGYDSKTMRNEFGYSAAFEYLFRPNDTSWAYQNLATAQTGTVTIEDSHYFMAKALGRYRFDNFIPYFGGGAGMGLFNVTGGPGVPSNSYTQPVVEGIAGIEYAVSSQISFFTEYKYLTTVSDMDVGGGLVLHPFGSHIVTMGMKYGF